MYRMMISGMIAEANPTPEPGASRNQRKASNSANPATMIVNSHAQGWSDHRPKDAASQAMPAPMASHPRGRSARTA